MSGDLGLLGVGSGVIQPGWVKKPTQEKEKEQPDGSVGSESEVDVRDARLLKEEVQKLAIMVEGYSQTYDMPSVAGNTTTNLDITVTSPDKVRAGDYVIWGGGATMNHGLVNQAGGPIPAPANDTIRVRVSNVTAAAIDAASMTHYFLIFRNVTAD